MGLIVVADQSENRMDRRRSSSRSQASSSSTRVERKILEKNRRNKMKHLYFMLNSLLPNQDPKEPKSLPEQIDEAANYIKFLETSVKEAKEKKESLMSKKRLHTTTTVCSTSSSTTLETFKAPRIEVRVRDSSALEVTLVSGIGNQFIFSDIVRILHEEKVEVLNANFSVTGSSVFHLIHAQIGDGSGGATIIERLKKLVNGSPADHKDSDQLQPQLWNDFEICPDLWDFEIMPGNACNLLHD